MTERLTRHFMPVADELGKSRAETYGNRDYAIVSKEPALSFRTEYGERYLLGSALRFRQIIYLAFGFGFTLGTVVMRVLL